MVIVALIPSYQPDERMVRLVGDLQSQGVACVVVDDGSGAGYATLFEEASRSASVIGYERNQGKGHALKLGLQYIQQRYPQDCVIVTVDADGQHALQDVLRCADQARETGNALILGCRSFDGPTVPLRSRVGNVVTRGVYRLASGIRVSDTQTGLRAFGAHMIPFLLDVDGERYEYEMNVLLACPRRDVEIVEVPIRTIYEDGNAASHFRPVRDSLRIYRGVVAFAAASFASFLVDALLFFVLSSLLAGLGSLGVGVANVGARLVSATVNFLLNRVVVFRSTESLYVTAVRYGLLALSILTANTLAVLVLCDVLMVPALVAKVLVESTFFLVSWVLQNRCVFSERRLSVSASQA